VHLTEDKSCLTAYCLLRQTTIKGGKRHYSVFWEFGTNSVQLRERKNGPLVPKRRQMKHLDFLILLLESRRSVVENRSNGWAECRDKKNVGTGPAGRYFS
jgi:hypothetical protein